jgi:hypothetical protein
MDESLSNVEKMKEYKKINVEISEDYSRIAELKKIMKEAVYIYVEKELVYIKEITELEKVINNLKDELIKIGIPVPEIEGYEIVNGLLEMKRDVNLKLIYYLDKKRIIEVFFIILFIFLFLVIWDKLRIFCLEKSFFICYNEE